MQVMSSGKNCGERRNTSRTHVVTGDTNCNPPVGVTGHVTGKPTGAVYAFLDVLDGPGKTPAVVTGTVPGSAQTDTLYCVHTGGGTATVYYFVSRNSLGWNSIGPF